MIARALGALERLLLPNACVACDRLVETRTPNALVCATCRARMRPMPKGCERCGQPLPPVGDCRFCSEWPERLSWAASAVWLGDEAKAVVHHLKYQRYKLLAALAAENVARYVPAPRGVCLVPIPLAARRLALRGHNQAEDIAKALASRWKCRVDTQVLSRVRETKTQTKLGWERRKENVEGAFRAVGGGRGHALVLIDDVLTTGATIVAAATALGTVGWRDIGAVTFARALTYPQRVEKELADHTPLG